jgi:FkbM family methyltransferase
MIMPLNTQSVIPAKIIRLIRRMLAYLFRSRMFRLLFDELARVSSNVFTKVEHGGVEVNISSGTALTNYRALTFASKEPDTLVWISKFQKGSNFWDIGANIGIYTIYAALKTEARVVAFEPIPASVRALCRNIQLNQIQDRVIVVPIPLAERTEVRELSIPSDEAGISHVAFGVDYGFSGKTHQYSTKTNFPGISWVDLISLYELPNPNYVKLDVDGIEHLILSGADNLLREVKELLVEVNYDFVEQREAVESIMKEKGFYLVSECASPLSTDIEHKETRNQIWVNANI